MSPSSWQGLRCRLARLLLCECDLDSGTEDKSLRATVKVAMDEEQAREQERVPGR